MWEGLNPGWRAASIAANVSARWRRNLDLLDCRTAPEQREPSLRTPGVEVRYRCKAEVKSGAVLRAPSPGRLAARITSSSSKADQSLIG